MKLKKKKKRVRFKTKKVLLLFIVLLIIGYIGYNFYNIKISNIYIKGNYYLTDQQIIDLAGIGKYPSTFNYTTGKIENKISKSNYIKEVVVTKKMFTRVYIEVTENKPLFLYQITGKTVLLNGKIVTDTFNVPILINEIKDKLYDSFVKDMADIDTKIIERISEIKYAPDNIDNSRFLFTMTDGNYVYLTSNKFDSINNYLNMVKQFNNKKGILYLNAGEYFEILED